MPKTKHTGHSGYLPSTKVKKQFYGVLLNLITEWVMKQPNPLDQQQLHGHHLPNEDAWEITSWGGTEVRLTCLPADGGQRHFFTVKLTEHHT